MSEIGYCYYCNTEVYVNSASRYYGGCTCETCYPIRKQLSYEIQKSRQSKE